MSDGLVCLSARDGTIDPSSSQGLYFRDLRLLSCLRLTLDGAVPELLASQRENARVSHQLFIAGRDAHGSPTALLRRRREIGAELVDRYRFEVYEGALSQLRLTLRLETDFQPAVKQPASRPESVGYDQVEGDWQASDGRFGVRLAVHGPPAERGAGEWSWGVSSAPGQPWSVDVVVSPRERDVAPEARAATAADRRRSSLSLRSGATTWRRSVASALADIEGLWMRVPHLELSYLAAGAPWFMALFGRDTLLTAWESLIAGTDVALETLEALTRFQGRRDDADTGEQPGKILHELRTGGLDLFGIQAGQPYYGTVDASPLFVMLLAEAHRWGADRERVRALLPAARAALEWCRKGGDPDGDGYVEYAADEHALVNQGWKDSGNAMVHADGSQAKGPIALAEVQAYVWAAYQALARLEADLGEPARVAGLQNQADALRTAFLDDFWCEDAALLAMGLDGEKQPMRVASSNMGHCLWAGILPDEIAARVAERLGEPDLLTRWGLRTLGSGEVAYNPLGYHLGSIWPHDSAIGAAGLMRAGRPDIALRLTDGLLAAAEHFAWRLPELFGGLAEGSAYPVPYPVSCSPQAWSAATPLMLLRTVLRLEPDVPDGRVRLAPMLSDDARVRVTGIPLGVGTLDLDVGGGDVQVLQVPEGVEVQIAEPGEEMR
ncbi:MAG: glycogen debranching N-terminal domain-containing protein [Egibacteraceae bacterium]